MRTINILAVALLLAFDARAAIQTINVGTSANDGTGDSLRSAFTKVNSNIQYLSTNVVPVSQLDPRVVATDVDGTLPSLTVGALSATQVVVGSVTASASGSKLLLNGSDLVARKYYGDLSLATNLCPAFPLTAIPTWPGGTMSDQQGNGLNGDLKFSIWGPGTPYGGLWLAAGSAFAGFEFRVPPSYVTGTNFVVEFCLLTTNASYIEFRPNVNERDPNGTSVSDYFVDSNETLRKGVNVLRYTNSIVATTNYVRLLLYSRAHNPTTNSIGWVGGSIRFY